LSSVPDAWLVIDGKPIIIMTMIASPLGAALVTGSSRGIGRAIALRLAARGHDVVVHYRRESAAAEEVAAEAERLGVRALVCRAEAEDPDQLALMFDQVGKEFGGLAVLVANAASTAFKPLLDVQPKHIDRTFATVVRSFILLAQHAAPLMSSGGRIVAMSGMDARFVQKGHGVLGAAKAAMDALVRYLAVELGSQGITVNSVLPGYVASDSSKLYLGDQAASFEKQIERYTPGGKAATVDDVATLVEFLCRPEAQFITGQNIVMDAGLSALGGPWAELNEQLPY
jgi:enoyl-[acyl-carrier protein] reductase III